MHIVYNWQHLFHKIYAIILHYALISDLFIFYIFLCLQVDMCMASLLTLNIKTVQSAMQPCIIWPKKSRIGEKNHRYKLAMSYNYTFKCFLLLWRPNSNWMWLYLKMHCTACKPFITTALSKVGLCKIGFTLY